MRTMRTTLLLLACCLVIAPAAFANHYSDFYVIPVASHVAGANGTMWMSDIAIYNFGTTPLTAELVLIASGDGTNSNNIVPVNTSRVNGSVTVPSGGSVLLSDVLGGQDGQNMTSGAILIGANRPFAVTSRSYSMAPSGDTVGQTVLPVRDFLDGTFGSIDLATAVAYIPGIIQNSRFRTNLGMVAANGSSSGATMGVTITLRNETGASVGSTVMSVAPGAAMHIQFSARSVSNATFDVGSADFRITQGTGSVVPYASVIDNNTADAVFVVGTFPTERNNATSVGTPLLRRIFDKAVAAVR